MCVCPPVTRRVYYQPWGDDLAERDYCALKLLMEWPSNMSAKQRNVIWSLDPDVAFPGLEDFAEANLGQPSDAHRGAQHQFLCCSCV
jgi:hypothetical protein